MKKLIAFALILSFVAAFSNPLSAAVAATPPDAGDGRLSTTDAAQRPIDWTISGPMGGDVRSLAVDPSDPLRLYFGTIDGQIYTSKDGAKTWTRLPNFNRPSLYIDNILIDPRDSKMIYAAAHRHKEPGGFFKTTDGGETWTEAAELKAEAIHSLTQSPSQPDVLIVGSNRGVWRSPDAGATWEKLQTSDYPGLINVESLAVDPRSSDVIYAGTWYLPYKTTDGGKTWGSIKTGMIDDSDVFAIEVNPHDPDQVIASACSGIYDSKNGGNQWRKVQGIPSQSRRTRAILQHPSIKGVVYAGTTEGFWRSTNGGDSWMLTTSRQLEINAIAVHPEAPQTIYIGANNYGVMVSKDGGKTFVPSNDGYSGRRAYSILPDREQPGRVYATTINTATGGGFFFVSNDGGLTWQPSMRNMPNRLIAYAILQDRADANIIYLGTNLGMYRSTDRGASWAPIAAPGSDEPKETKKGPRLGSGKASAATQVKRAQEALALAGYEVGTPDGVAGPLTVAALRKFQAAKRLPQSGRLDHTTLVALGLAGGAQTGSAAAGLQDAPIALTETINALIYASAPKGDGSVMLAATNGGLYQTADPLKGWQRLSYGEGFDSRTLCVSAIAQHPETIWVGTSTSGVLVTRDGGKTWSAVGGVPSIAPINVIEQDVKRPENIYVGTTQTLYISHDGGERWLRRGGNLPYGSYTSVLINPQNPDEIFVGSAYERPDNNGVFHSADAGMTWKRIDPEMPSRRVWALALDPADPGRLLVGSHSAGVYVARRDLNAAAAVAPAGAK
ncbi:MAG: YCF48-related protein [Pyrinomonadaceae bacterium]